MRSSIQERLERAHDKCKKNYNLRSRTRLLDIGQIVFWRNFIQSSLADKFNAKLAPTGVRATVIRKIGNVNYELRDCESGKLGVKHIKDIWT